MKIAAVSGASSGIGQAIAIALVQRGWMVYGLSRSACKGEGIRSLPTDVTDDNQVAAAFEHIKQERGSIDLLVNCAGFGISGATEYTRLSDAKRLLDVNFFGAFCCIQHAVPLMREKGGRIINISSAAAIFSIPFQTFYSASKAALNSLTLALANELKMFGISVCALMPGDVATGFTAARDKSDEGTELYGGRIACSVAVMEKDEKNGMAPEDIARQVIKIVEKRKIRVLYTPGLQYKVFAVLNKLLPVQLVNSLVGKMYIKSPK